MMMIILKLNNLLTITITVTYTPAILILYLFYLYFFYASDLIFDYLIYTIQVTVYTNTTKTNHDDSLHLISSRNFQFAHKIISKLSFTLT